MSERAKRAGGRILVLADDLTGGLEAGAKFARQGITAQVIVANQDWIPAIPRDVLVLVLDTETRHLPPAAAERRIYALSTAAMAGGFGIIYKKTDSTLRGNIGSELKALLHAFPCCALLYVPAYPKMGRTVKQGILYVNGQPVSATDFASDQLNPITESSILKLLSPHVPLPTISVDEEKACVVGDTAVYVCDADSEKQVEAWARFFLGQGMFKLAAGPAAFLHCLAKHVQMPRSGLAQFPRVNQALIVCGSRNRKSLDQIEYAREEGFPVLESAGQLEQMGHRGWWILDNSSDGMESSEEATARMAKRVVSIVNRTELDALVVFGGDTAYAVLRALRTSEARPIGEATEGVPVAKIKLQPVPGSSENTERDLLLITKAGGFGPRNVLPIIRDALA